MFIPERYRKATNDTSEDVEQLGSTVEFMVFMNECEEALVDSLTDHFSAGYEFCIELVQDILQIIPFDRFLRIKQFQEFLDELRCDIDFE